MTSHTIPARSRPYRSYTYWITSSRRSCSKSTSMSGGSPRSAEMNRSNRSPIRTGSIEVIPRTKQTAELAALPRPWHRMPRAREPDDVPDREEVARVPELLDERELLRELAADVLRRLAAVPPAGPLPHELAQERHPAHTDVWRRRAPDVAGDGRTRGGVRSFGRAFPAARVHEFVV